MKVLEISTNLNFILNPCNPQKKYLELHHPIRKAAGIALFILLGICTVTISAIVLISLAYKKRATFLSQQDFCLQNLDQFLKKAKKLNLDSPLENSVEKIKKILSYNKLHIAQSYENHLLHDHVTEITCSVQKEEKLKKVWKVFLNAIDHIQLTYPSGKQFVLDFAPEKAILEQEIRNTEELSTEKSNPDSDSYESDLDEAYKIFDEAFPYGMSRSAFIEDIRRNSLELVLVKNPSSKEILGFATLKLEKENDQSIWLISQFARKANAAKLGVGNLIMKFVKNIFSQTPAYLQVRENNKTAISLYEKYGFKIQNRLTGYYDHPKEDAYLMRYEPAR